jgi:hypothetical protein
LVLAALGDTLLLSTHARHCNPSEKIVTCLLLSPPAVSTHTRAASRLAIAGSIASSAAYVTGKLAELVGKASYATALAIARSLPGHGSKKAAKAPGVVWCCAVWALQHCHHELALTVSWLPIPRVMWPHGSRRSRRRRHRQP